MIYVYIYVCVLLYEAYRSRVQLSPGCPFPFQACLSKLHRPRECFVSLPLDNNNDDDDSTCSPLLESNLVELESDLELQTSGRISAAKSKGARIHDQAAQ